ncbi:MAG: Crp/Fnr family transcriptional regulator [Pseudomonadota bacterium]
MADTELSFNPAEFARIGLFASVSIFDVEDVILECPLEEVEADRVILEPGATNDRLYVVLRGDVTVHLTRPDRPAVHQFGPGEVFGELSVLDQQPVCAFVKAASKCRLLAIPRPALLTLFERSPYLANNMLATMSQRIRASNRTIQSLLKPGADDGFDAAATISL